MTITKKPPHFSLTYGSGESVGLSDPETGIGFYRLCWPALKAAMRRLAERADDTVTLINERNRDALTVSPEGRWS